MTQPNETLPMLLSVVVPCYNEESVISMTYRALSAELSALVSDGEDYEMIFVNDGSKDGTLSQLKSFAQNDPHLKYISFSRNFGKESAMLAGLRYATGQYTAIMDADLQHPPELLAQMLREARKGYDQHDL